MSISRGGSAPIAVEGAASGAAPFDGNNTNHVVSWMFAHPDWNEASVPEMLDRLMEYTKWGNLSWVVFPKQGFRL